MAFVIKPLRHEDLDRIYPADEEEQIKKFTYAKRDWPQDMHHLNWAVDEQSGAFLLLLPFKRDDSGMQYLFGVDGSVAVLRNDSYCVFSFMYLPAAMQVRMKDVEQLIRYAFRSAGALLDGTTDEGDPVAVPNAQFTSKNA